MPTVTIQQALEAALEHHQAGRLAEAETIYRQVLAVQPQNVDAIHYLGVIAHQVDRHDTAIEMIQRAIALYPHDASMYSNLSAVYRRMGRLPEAVQALRQALALRPDYADAHNNLGIVLAAQGHFEEAVAHHRRVVELRPEDAEGHNNLGAALAGQGRFDEAMTEYERAAALNPKLAEVHNNVGHACQHRGDLEAAVAAFRRAIEHAPQLAEAHNNLGNALHRLGQTPEAWEAYQRAIQLNPRYPDPHLNLGNVLRDRGQSEEAMACYRRALELRPAYSEAYHNLGNVLGDLGRFDEAIEAYRQSIALRPDYMDAHYHLSTVLRDRAALDEALVECRRALELQPDQAQVRSDLILTLHLHPAYDARVIAEEQRAWNRWIAEPLRLGIVVAVHDRDPGRRLRIGYVSPDFRDHVVGRNLEPLFQHHDRTQFEIFGYSGVRRPDSRTEEFRRRYAAWRETVRVDDAALAEMIRQDGVDILVDLTQHSTDSRLPVFARRPAPVQVSFAGYPASTGLEAIRYRISDAFLEGGLTKGGGEESERVFLIDSFWCYDPCGIELPVNALPAEERGYVTFGSLNNFCKINDPLLKLWARLLRAVPGSRLMLLTGAGAHRQRTVEFLKDEGVESGRVEFAERRPRQEYLALYHEVDLVLDPFPYGGHTTTLDALWMGVPVVSLAGETTVSRAGWSILSNLGLPELVAFSGDDYLALAQRLAEDRPRLAELRATLRSRLEKSVLMNGEHFTRQIEAAYRAMWREWCAEALR